MEVANINPEQPRDHLINTAVKFLVNPRVMRSNLSQKKIFLRQKGLTEQEIDLACQQAGPYTDDQISKMSLQPYHETRISFWMKAKDVANMVALISIGSYSLYSIWRRYIAPRLFGTRSRNEENYDKLLTAILKLNENVMDLKEMFHGMQKHESRSPNSFQKSKNSYELHELKNELSAIKSLLLSRNQFPSSPGIPAWQLLEAPDPAEGSYEGEHSEGDSNSEMGRRRKQKSQPRTNQDDENDDGGDSNEGESSTGIRKHSSVDLDSNNGFTSGSSCEVVFVGGKNDSDRDASDPDQSGDD